MLTNKTYSGCRGTDQKGFTLVEILVSVAIIAIMAGMMVPLFGNIWLSNEKSDTRQKMADLKRAMVGDKRMVQNGIRMHYGFVGDYGVLPSFIADLVIEPTWAASGIWQGPYLVGAFDMADYYNDAWGRELVYTTYDPPLEVKYEVAGHPDVTLYFAATLKSRGFDGLLGTDDDLDERSDPELQILASEVWPTTKVQGNLEYVFTATISDTPVLSTKLYASYKVPSGTYNVFSVCPQLEVGVVEPGFPVRKSLTLEIPIEVPIGRVVVGSRLYADDHCGTEVPLVNEVALYVNEGMSTLTANLPTINYPIN